MSEFMSDDNEKQARDLLGRTVDYRGRTCRVVELLDDPPALILQDEGSGTEMQANQHGEAHRRVPRNYTVALYHYNAAGEREVHPDFRALQAAD
ncbi:hypothetical protein [Thiohalospira halophila]|nr:hypothetical protein [Thiohalospira halophila]